ncbi:MAG: HAD family hydrolase [Deltaproteobacteria bacterium]|nr:HAD family hydrolase [Deltaproteobacteria bacterium]
MTKMTLLIFDLDETLFFSAEKPLDRPEDFNVGPYACYRRPLVEQLLEVVSRFFTVAVWTTSSAAYAREVVAALFPPSLKLAFVWSRRQCTQALHPRLGVKIWIKDLVDLERENYTLTRTLIVDDSPEKLCRQPENLIPISPFLGRLDDRELEALVAYLPRLAEIEDVRTLNKETWSTR